MSKKHVCDNLTQIGVWDAVDSTDCPINGPVVRCEDCGLEFHLTWEKWECISEKSKKIEERVFV